MKCNNCEHLSPTEKEQNLVKRKAGIILPHICKKYDKRVFHFPYTHPNIHPCEECIKDKKKGKKG